MPAPRSSPTPSKRRPADNSAVLTASARRFDISQAAERTLLRKIEQEWQEQAWTYFDTVPEIGFAVRYVGHMLSRLQLFPAYRPDPNAEPIPLDPDNEDQIAEGLAPIATAARVEVERLAGPTGDHGAIMGPLAMNVSVVGEAFLCGIPDLEAAGGEKWEVYSLDELKITDQDVRVLAGPDDKEGDPLDPNTFFLRIWQRHPRWRYRADSSMRALLNTCEELLLLSRGIRAAATQRLNAGIFLVPNEMSIVNPPKQPGANPAGDPQQNPLLAAIMDAMELPIQQPDAASALVPLLLKGPKDALQQVRHLTIDRPFDQMQLEQRTELRRVIATGLDLPNEILLGMSDANHWTAWLVDEQTYKAHLDPLALQILDGMTRGILQPALAEQGFIPTNVVIWRDPQDLIADNDVWPRALAAHDAWVISDAALRRAGRFSEEDEPDEEEIAERIAIEQASRAAPFGQNPAGEQSFAPPGQAPTQDQQGPPEQPSPEEQQQPEAAGLQLVAAALQSAGSLDRLAIRLLEIDRRLRAALSAAADAAVQRALEVAGSKIRRRVQGGLEKIPDEALRRRRASLRSQLAGMESAQIAAQLGRSTVVTLGLDEEDLIDSELGDLSTGDDPPPKSLAALFLARTSAAYAEARRLSMRELRGSIDPGEVDAMEERQRKLIDAGFLVLAGGITSVIRDRLFNPNPQAPPQGEFDASVTVPPGMIREALAVAGGAPTAAPDASTGGPSGGIATGEETQGMLSQFFGVTANGGRWIYGDAGSRKTPFEPHEALDGIDFSSWDDEVLSNTEIWPDNPFFFPGDHDYCQCDYIPALELGAEEG